MASINRARWILASASPRRRALLSAADQEFTVEASGIVEGERRRDESPEAFALRLATAKGEEVARRPHGRWVLAADTIVVAGDEVLGKPRDTLEARSMLAKLSDREHRVITAFALLAPDGRVTVCEAVTTTVVFRRLSDDEIAAYVATGEPHDKAGAYAIQGGAAGFVRRLSGSYSNVVGLPLEAVEHALRSAGLWRERKTKETRRA